MREKKISQNKRYMKTFEEYFDEKPTVAFLFLVFQILLPIIII